MRLWNGPVWRNSGPDDEWLTIRVMNSPKRGLTTRMAGSGDALNSPLASGWWGEGQAVTLERVNPFFDDLA